MYVDLRDVGTLREHVFKLLGRDVFSLLKFEDILSSVDDLNCTIREHYANIASMQPSVSYRVLCLRLIFEIPSKHRGALETNLSSWVGLISG